MTLSATSGYNQNQKREAVTENGFSEPAFKAGSEKSVFSVTGTEQELAARVTARAWVDAAVLNGMQLRNQEQRELLIDRATLPAGRARRAVEEHTRSLFVTGKRPSGNRSDWEPALRRLEDIADAAVAEEDAGPLDQRPRWYLTDRMHDVTWAVMTYDRQEAADRQKEGWSVVGHEVDDDPYQDEHGVWWRNYLDGTRGRLDLRGLSEWERHFQGEDACAG